MKGYHNRKYRRREGWLGITTDKGLGKGGVWCLVEAKVG